MKQILLALFMLASMALAVDFREADTSGVERINPAKNDKQLLSYADSIKHARKCVVNISTQKNVKTGQYGNPLFNDPFFRQFFDPRQFNIPKERVERSLGSGVVVTEDGYIITNNHVVEGADKVIVSIPGDEKDYEAKVIGTDAKSDLAVIKIEGKKFAAITLYDSDKVEVGDVVFAIGNPFGVGETVTQGIISATNRSSVGIVEYEDFIQTDAPINPGNSGGALINSQGHLVGINSAIISRGGGNVGIGFAIPVNMAKKITATLIEKGTFERAYLGVSIGDVTEDLYQFYKTRSGSVVMGVQEDSAAEKAGIKRGDLIVAINGKDVKDSAGLKNLVGSIAPGETISVTLIRDGKRRTLKATLQSSDSDVASRDGYEYQGMQVEPLSDSLRDKLRLGDRVRGVVVTDVKEGSNADKAGFRSGDVIVQVENTEIKEIDDLRQIQRDKGKKRYFIQRGRGIFVLVL